MEPEQGPALRGPVPRLSRLPMPRASQDNLKLARPTTGPGIHHDDASKNSNLPRPAKINSSRIVPPVPLGENANKSIKSRYGWNDHSVRSRNRSPVRDALQAAQSASLETTPPSFNGQVPLFEHGDENDVHDATAGAEEVGEVKEKRRPRPSLSERTAETLSQVSPSPSPTRRRRSSVFSNNSAMGPPMRPASSMRSHTPSSARPESPIKRAFRPPGRASPTKELMNFAPVPSPGSIHTPPRVFVREKNSRIGKPASETRRSMSSTTHDSVQEPAPTMPPRLGAQTMRLKASYQNLQAPKQSKPALETIFKDPMPAPSKGTLAVSGLHQNPSLLRPRSIGENTLAPSSPKLGSANLKPASASIGSENIDAPSEKSSAALRETIAAAKAARKAAGSSKQTPGPTGTASSFSADLILDDGLVANGSNKGLLRKRIDGALSSGQLNIAAMQLQQIPDEVMKMYEPGGSSINWAEMVDLVKLNAADNQIQHLGDENFPDWSASDLVEDDEKNNQFAGLEALDLHNNLLPELPVGMRRLERLTSLNLSGNKLRMAVLDIVWQIPNLKELYLANNLLEGSLSFDKVQSHGLRVLDFHGNQIESLDFELSMLPSLQILNISENRLSQLPWELLASLPLFELNVATNRLTGMLLRNISPGFKTLRTLDVSHNAVEAISDSPIEFPSLQTLSVSVNRLTRLPDISEWQSLVTLLVSDNQLTEIPSSMSKLGSLKSADFSQNSIKAVDAGICKMESLATLNLAGNPLRDRKYLTMDTLDLKLDLEKRFAPDEEAEMKASGSGLIPGVTPVPGSGNSTYIYTPVKGVLDLASRNLSEISLATIDLTANTPIHTVRLSNNDLTAFPYDLLSHPSLKYSLTTLNLSHNPLLHPTAYLTADLFLPQLQSLYVVSTGLTSLDALTTYLRAPALKELNISCHRLTGHLPWTRAWFPELNTLLATDNWFSSVDVEAVRGLEVLDIRNNEIESLPAKLGLLGNFPSKTKLEQGRLRVFECSGNRFRVPRVTVIEKGTEAVLKDLRRMVLAADVPEEWAAEI